MALNANSLSGFLQVYAYKAIPTFMADMPPRDLFTENFDASIANEGTAVVTRLATTNFGTSLNDLSTGWENQQATASSVTVTLATKGGDHNFNVTSWATVGEQQLLNTFTNILGKRVANGIFVNIANNVSSSVFTNVAYVGSSSLFNLTGSLNQVNNATGSNTGLQSIGTLLDNLEIPQGERYAIVNPVAYQGLISNIWQTYQYGSDRLAVGNGFVDSTVKNQAYPGLSVAGFNVFKSPRININTAKLPYGGDKYQVNSNILAGWAGNKAGIAFAARVPITFTAPWMTTYTVTDPTSGFPLQYILALDPSLPGIRLGIYSLFGSAAGNTNAIVPILSTTT